MFLSILLTAYFWLLIGLVLAVVAWAIIVTVVRSTGRYRDFSLIRDWLASLLRRGYEGGYLCLTHETSGRYLQFEKYIRGKGDYGLEFRGLGSDCLESTRNKAEAFADDHGLSHRVEPSTSRDSGESLLVIDCGLDTTATYDIALSIWTEVFGLSLKSPYKAELDGHSELDELIDGPDHPPPLWSLPPEDRLREHDARSRKLGEPRPMTFLFLGVMVIVVLISGIGFPISMLMSRGEVPDWSFELGAVSLGGSTPSLVFLVAFLLSLWPVVGIDVGEVRQPKTRYKRQLRWLMRAIAIGLPFAVLLTWAGF